jgi:hypothetical protein
MRIILLLLVLLTATVVLAQDQAATQAPELEKLSGKELYKLSCKHCHGAKAAAGEVSPMSLIQDQWNEFFAKGYLATHEALIDSTRGNLPVPQLITPPMLDKIKKFCVDGAADSEHPMTCG